MRVSIPKLNYGSFHPNVTQSQVTVLGRILAMLMALPFATTIKDKWVENPRYDGENSELGQPCVGWDGIE